MATQRCMIYARISVSTDESTSIERQVDLANKYAAARGWQVVGTFVDDGVSATHNKPEARPGWRALLDSTEPYGVVLVWKVDRLARRTLDFLHAAEALRARGAAIAAVEESIDMTTDQGRAFATMLAVFGEMEASAIRDRVKAARRTLVNSGRQPGGTVPYGWRSVPNPHGKGLVLAIDPQRIGYVREAAERVRRGDTIYSVVRWLDEVNAPLPSKRAKVWSYSTVERLLRNPVLAGMTAHNPGNKTKDRGCEVVRGKDGLPVVDEAVAILPAGEWRALVRKLDERDSGQSRPVALRARTSGLLSGLVWCGEHVETRMHRGTRQGREGYACPVCYQVITNFESVVVDEFLRQKGERVRWSVVEEVHEGGAALLPEIENRLAELTAQLQATDDDTEADALSEQIGNMRAMRREARARAPRVELRSVRDPIETFGDDWAAAGTVEEQRAVLDDAIGRIWVLRGGTGRRTPEGVLARLVFEWKQPEDIGPLDIPDDETLARWAEQSPLPGRARPVLAFDAAPLAIQQRVIDSLATSTARGRSTPTPSPSPGVSEQARN